MGDAPLLGDGRYRQVDLCKVTTFQVVYVYASRCLRHEIPVMFSLEKQTKIAGLQQSGWSENPTKRSEGTFPRVVNPRSLTNDCLATAGHRN